MKRMYAKSEEATSGSSGITASVIGVLPAREARQLETVRGIVRGICLRSSGPPALDLQLAGTPVPLAQPKELARHGAHELGPSRYRRASRAGPEGEGGALLALDDQASRGLVGAEVGQVVLAQVGRDVALQTMGVLRRTPEEHLRSRVS